LPSPRKSALCNTIIRKKLPSDLVQLMGKQIESLQKETFVGLTAAERREYDERQHRIDELCEELRYLHPAA
jgi:hypothetical protein